MEPVDFKFTGGHIFLPGSRAIRRAPGRFLKAIWWKTSSGVNEPRAGWEPWVVPLPSHHRDFYIFRRGSLPEPSFATGILGAGTIQIIPFWDSHKNLRCFQPFQFSKIENRFRSTLFCLFSEGFHMTILQVFFSFFFFSDRGSSFELKFLLNVVDLNVDFHQL